MAVSQKVNTRCHSSKPGQIYLSVGSFSGFLFSLHFLPSLPSSTQTEAAGENVFKSIIMQQIGFLYKKIEQTFCFKLNSLHGRSKIIGHEIEIKLLNTFCTQCL